MTEPIEIEPPEPKADYWLIFSHPVWTWADLIGPVEPEISQPKPMTVMDLYRENVTNVGWPK
jgi:hypothetical protein